MVNTCGYHVWSLSSKYYSWTLKYSKLQGIPYKHNPLKCVRRSCPLVPQACVCTTKMICCGYPCFSFHWNDKVHVSVAAGHMFFVTMCSHSKYAYVFHHSGRQSRSSEMHHLVWVTNILYIYIYTYTKRRIALLGGSTWVGNLSLFKDATKRASSLHFPSTAAFRTFLLRLTLSRCKHRSFHSSKQSPLL